MLRLKGAGLPNVFLRDGVVEGPAGSVAYRDLDGLYHALAGAIAMRSGALTGPELRFLRKRLEMTQEDVGRLGDKSAQIVAKWEKGTAPVPVAESTMLRLVWLERYAKRYLAAAVRAFFDDAIEAVPCDYVMRFVEGDGWREDIEQAQALAKQRANEHVVQALSEAMSRDDVAVYAVTNVVDMSDFIEGGAIPTQQEELFT